MPGQFSVSSTVLVKANMYGVYRCLTDKVNWQKFYSASDKNISTTIQQNNILPDAFNISYITNNVTYEGNIELLALNNDSSFIKLSVKTNATGLFKKIKQYTYKSELKKTLNGVLGNMKNFFEKEENVYGSNIYKSTIKDTLLISIKTSFKSYPSVQDIYHLISQLQHYADKNGSKENGYPMLHIKNTDSPSFETMVALPVDKKLDDNDLIQRKEMFAGNVLLIEVKGGIYTVSKAFTNLENYVADHDLQSPAIAFQSLITNRLQETDTTKWITRIYYPIY
ncbi:MAG TPA: hypothetical protein VFW07_04545 [Parafilimonas sp.]|nr:hypothetical protein [Parafilimonas sp.]